MNTSLRGSVSVWKCQLLAEVALLIAHVPHVDVSILAFGHGPADRVSEGFV